MNWPDFAAGGIAAASIGAVWLSFRPRREPPRMVDPVRLPEAPSELVVAVGSGWIVDPQRAEEDRFTQQIVEDYLRRGDIQARAQGVPEGNAVYDPLKDRCAACDHSLGAPGIYMGIPFSLCVATPAGKPCGRYRSSQLLTAEVMEKQAAATRQAQARLHYDDPTTLPDDPEMRAFYANRLGFDPEAWPELGCGVECDTPKSCKAKGQCKRGRSWQT